jgi:hypothetical protein
MRPIPTVIATFALYVGFCALTYGYYISPEEWLTGSYRHAAGHVCLAHTDTCRKWFPNNYMAGDTYSYDGDYRDDEPTPNRRGKL